MVELIGNGLEFSFPEVHPEARLTVKFQRTLRIPDNGKTYPLPPGLGEFPLRHVDDFAKSVPPQWSAHGGVMLPMYQSEALWILFESDWIGDRDTEYPFAIKIAAGKINAVTGAAWGNDLRADPQDYAVSPAQPWLDGFAIEKGVIRQFVAMPLGSGYSAEEQLTGKAEHGGLQILVHPMKRTEFDRRFPVVKRELVVASRLLTDTGAMAMPCASLSMGMAPGGKMKQEIYRDKFGIDAWDRSERSRCFVHIVNTLVWEAVTHSKPPTPPMTSAQYYAHKLPWFDYYAEGQSALDGGEALKRLRSVIEIARQRGDVPLPENEDVRPEPVEVLRPRPRHLVREGTF